MTFNKRCTCATNHLRQANIHWVFQPKVFFMSGYFIYIIYFYYYVLFICEINLKLLHNNEVCPQVKNRPIKVWRIKVQTHIGRFSSTVAKIR